MRGKLLSSALLGLGLMVTSHANSAVVEIDYDQSFGAVSPDGPSPWATATFDDGGTAGSVTLTMEVASTVGMADVTAMYFNLNPNLDVEGLNFLYASGSGDAASSIITCPPEKDNKCKADGDGYYDIVFSWSNDSFNAGEVVVYNITSTDPITAANFNWEATPGGGPGPFVSVARFQSTGPYGGDSDWVGGGDPRRPPNEIPVPAAVWLFGSGLLGLVGVARRKHA